MSEARTGPSSLIDTARHVAAMSVRACTQPTEAQGSVGQPRETGRVKKLPKDDRRAKYLATTTVVDRDGLAEHLADRHRWVLATTRSDGRPQMSLVSGGMLPDGRLAISTYPGRVKAKNVRRDPHVSVAVMGDEFNDAWVQIDGDGAVLDAEADGDEGVAALDAFVEYYRSISGEHPDWDEYRQAMQDQGKSIILVTPTRWSPVSTGGFPPELFED